MEALGLAGTIINLASLGTEITKRLRSISNRPTLSEHLQRLAAEVETIVQVLHELPKLLQNNRGTLSDNFSQSLSATLTQLADKLERLDSLSLTLQADMASPQKRFRASWHFEQKKYMLEEQELERVKHTLLLFVRSVVEVLDLALFQTLTLYASVMIQTDTTKKRTGNAVEQIEQSEQLDVVLIRTYQSTLSKRQKQFLGKIAFSSGINYYFQLQHPPAVTGVATNDPIQTQGCDPATPGLTPFQEIKDEEVEPLISEAQHGDQIRLLFVYQACDRNSGLKIL